MCLQQEEYNPHKDKHLEEGLLSIVRAQLETYELWEIDDCVRILFELGNGE